MRVDSDSERMQVPLTAYTNKICAHKREIQTDGRWLIAKVLMGAA